MTCRLLNLMSALLLLLCVAVVAVLPVLGLPHVARCEGHGDDELRLAASALGDMWCG